MQLHPGDFFDLSEAETSKFFEGIDLVWELFHSWPELVVEILGDERKIAGEIMPGAVIADGPMFIGKGARVEPGSYVSSPAYIGPSVVIRHGAYIRANCVMLAGSLLGHASEAKNSLFLPGAKAPHFCYVGDSILGHRVNLGAGTKLSNVPITSGSNGSGRAPRTISLDIDGESFDTGLRKLGAILGDDVQTGCNVSLNPGTLIGARSLVYPNATLPKGLHQQDTIVKLRQHIEKAQRT
jgi:NDP-sugar pyrophosphorylase family protein